MSVIKYLYNIILCIALHIAPYTAHFGAPQFKKIWVLPGFKACGYPEPQKITSYSGFLSPQFDKALSNER